MEIAGMPGDTVVIVSPDEFSWFANLGGLVMDWLTVPEVDVHVFVATHRSTEDVTRLIKSPPFGVTPHYLGWMPIPDDPISNGDWIKVWNDNHPASEHVVSSDDIAPEWKWAVAQENIAIPCDILGKMEDSLWDAIAESRDPDNTIMIFPLGTAGPMSHCLYKVSHRFPCLRYMEWPSVTRHADVGQRLSNKLCHRFFISSPTTKATFFRRIFHNQTSMFPVVNQLQVEVVVGPVVA